MIGIEVKGSKRWLDLFFLPRLQPIELVKPFFIIILSFNYFKQKKISNFTTKFIFSFLLTCLIVLFLLLQPDLGQTLLIAFSWAITIFVSGINLFFFISISIIGIILLLFIATFYIPKFEYIKNRLISFFDNQNRYP